MTEAPQNAKPPEWVGYVFIFLVLVPGAIWFMAKDYERGEARKVQEAIERQRIANLPETKRLMTTIATAKVIKSRLRDPESVVWEEILANTDASVVCIQYRAKNGFGGMSREYYVSARGKVSTDSAAVNKHCKNLYDMKKAIHAL